MDVYIIELSMQHYQKFLALTSIYNTVKQIIETFATTQSNAFKEVVLIEYPQKDMYALSFSD